MDRNILRIFVAALAIIGIGYGLSTPPGQSLVASAGIQFLDTTENAPFSYATLSGYLDSGETVAYPTVFNSMSAATADEIDDPKITFTPAYWKDFLISMEVTKFTTTESDAEKAALLAQGFVSEGMRKNTTGQEGELFVADEIAHPTGAESCSLTQHYFVPISQTADVLVLMFNVSQTSWVPQSDTTCTLYDEKNYTDLKGMADYVIANLHP
ncbi:hypothetical protein HY416_02175 [Candidatus Kaiserbacteria bacterium]|nr:hypothetical protein [Candidatus Kaiserbacteria bacterium]